MHNWDYPKMEKTAYDEVWHLERLLTYGLGGEKVERKALERNFNTLVIPEDTRAFFELLLWDKTF